MLKRTLTGLVILLITFAFVMLKQVHQICFDLFVLAIAYLAVFEIKNTTKQRFCIIFLLIPAVFCVFLNFQYFKNNIFLWLVLSVLFVLFVSIASELVRPNGLFEKTKNTMQLVGYPTLPIMFLMFVNHMPYEVGYVGIVLVFAVSMLTDTFAYLFGIKFGKHKLAPVISPKKSVEGFVGGFVGGLVGASLCFVLFYFTNWFTVLKVAELGTSIVTFALIGVFGSLATQFGDLIASAYKRKFGIKDFGNIFPGHGGVMDRVDGAMLNAVLVYLFLALFFV